MENIETNYAGYHFRSRLEARWAVFFDHAGIEFEYEPEGFLLPWRFQEGWNKRTTKFRYLPDFWLPALGMWAEVKGRWSAHERIKALNGMAALCEFGNDVLLLPDVFRQPRGGSNRPWRMSLWGSTLVARPWPAIDDVVERIADEDDPTVLQSSVDLLRGYRDEIPNEDWFISAARAAQRARFEFGETPWREHKK